ncbi:MAG: hypothetical protein ACXAB7_20720 [Candidatus Kariarchaeaceae archaeon]
MKKPNHKKKQNMGNGKISLTAYGAAGEVGRSALLLEDRDRKVLLQVSNSNQLSCHLHLKDSRKEHPKLMLLFYHMHMWTILVTSQHYGNMGIMGNYT